MSHFFSDNHIFVRILIIVLLVVVAHLTVILVRRAGKRLTTIRPRPALSKARSLASLATSIVVFMLYFATVGIVLKEFGVSLTAYLASASVMGLAIGFGSQGLVQDVVAGLTLIFSGLIDLGDMVEISGQTGIVRQIGMRFTVLENPFGAHISLPNRSITHVLNYPRGYLRCLFDITLGQDPDMANRMESRVDAIISSAFEQYQGVFLSPPAKGLRVNTASGKSFLRIKLRIWPGRGATIENVVKPEITQSLKSLDPAYTDWMVSVTYEVEKKDLI